LPINTEKMATPNNNINDPSNLSIFDLGFISPNPTVDKDVNAKYIIAITMYRGSL
jgi:hypothetical protein